MADVTLQEQAVEATLLGDTASRIYGLTGAARLRRTLARLKVAEGRAAPGALILRADWVYDESLVKALAGAPGTVLVADDGWPVAAHVGRAGAFATEAALRDRNLQALPDGLASRTARDLAGTYNATLRKKAEPILLPLDAATLPMLRRRLFSGSYKGTTDLVTKYVWPPVALQVTRACAALGITPNQVTFASLLLVLAVLWLFATGHFALGLACGWAMSFLDTVDGKLARVTLTSSKWGNVFDHGIDLVHPPFWWWAWVVGLEAAGMPLACRGLVLAVVIGGYVLQRVEEGVFIRFFGMEMHIWRRFDSLFRLITARRNPNLLILTVAVVCGRPDLGMAAVAVWTALCLLVHLGQIVQASLAARRGPLTSWLASP